MESETDALLARKLQRVCHQLEVARAATSIAATTLHHQNVDQDRDIAAVLIHCVSRRLIAEIETLLATAAAITALPSEHHTTLEPADVTYGGEELRDPPISSSYARLQPRLALGSALRHHWHCSESNKLPATATSLALLPQCTHATREHAP